MEELMVLLKNCCPTVDFANEKHLMSEKVLDSMDIVSIMEKIEDQYNISIEYDMIIPANFDSAESLYALVRRLKKN